MRYLGGKSRIAREIAEIVNAERGVRLFWDPFCGGLSVSAALARGGPGVVSDAFAPLISLYSAVVGGWVPPQSLTEEEYRAAKYAPDSDPIKAFAGFGCSFGGKWFGGYARSLGRNYTAAETRRILIRHAEAIQGCALGCVDFLAVEPHAREIVIYADPPYAGTTGYALAFDSTRFWARVRSWERVGVPVFVSEYACPVPHRIVWEKAHSLSVCGGSRSAARVERLFRVLV